MMMIYLDLVLGPRGSVMVIVHIMLATARLVSLVRKDVESP